MNCRKNEKGVTLIILAVTIVVMLILANVSLSSLKGQDNTIQQAKDNTNATERKEQEDAIRIAIQESMLASKKDEFETELFKKYLDKHIKNYRIQESGSDIYIFTYSEQNYNDGNFDKYKFRFKVTNKGEVFIIK